VKKTDQDGKYYNYLPIRFRNSLLEARELSMATSTLTCELISKFKREER
jgi:hypothetical protein